MPVAFTITRISFIASIPFMFYIAYIITTPATTSIPLVTFYGTPSAVTYEPVVL
jgi:hypothetical protein